MDEAPGAPLPTDVQRAFEGAHNVELATVRVHALAHLASHGIRGLSRGHDILLADGGDRDALEHELGHVVDAIGAGGAPPNASLDGLPLADDPAREARADQLAAQARAAPKAMVPGKRAAPSPATDGAPLPKLTSRAAITRSGGNFQWADHRTRSAPRALAAGGGRTADGLGSTLSTAVPIACAATAEHKQLRTLLATVPPAFVDSTRPALPEPPDHLGGHKGVYVLPAAMLGSAIETNRVYLPAAAIAMFRTFQTDMVAMAKIAPVRVTANTTPSSVGLASRFAITCEALDLAGTTVVRTIAWTVDPPADPATWGTSAAPAATVTGGALPATGEWKTDIEWSPAHASGDGTRVTAKKLGPDHRLGSTPSSEIAAGRVTELQDASRSRTGTGKSARTRVEPYVAGHLLNDHLGGPGDRAINLAPIPKKANSQMHASIEAPVKEIVNTRRGWVRYDLRITHTHDATANVDYPSKIEAEIEMLNPDGSRSGRNTASIDIASPSSFKDGSADAPVADRQLDGAAVVTSPLMLDEVILTHENDLRPNLRDAKELFDTIAASGVDVQFANPKVARAWAKTLDELEAFGTKALPDLNLLSTLTAAMDAYRANRNDLAAIAFLGKTSAGSVQTALENTYTKARALVGNANAYLGAAKAFVRKKMALSDLFRNAELIRLAEDIVENVPPQHSMLEMVQSMRAASVPAHVHAESAANARDDSAAATPHTAFLASYSASSAGPGASAAAAAAAPSYSTSPVRVFDASGTSVADLSSMAFYGARFDSVRGPKAITAITALCTAKNGGAIATLGNDAEVKKSESLRAILGQALEATKLETAQLAPYLEKHQVTWRDSLLLVAMMAPKIADRLYTLLGVT
ncbi:MAG TPA: hypothetical protein VGM88_29550 [Kofleriaceae bacterium]